MDKKYAPVVLRYGIAGLFLWFGISNIVNPSLFLGYLPGFAFNLSISTESILLFTGIFEVVLGLALLIGFYTRFVALILGLHLLGISIGLGYNDVAIRDYALTIATFAIAINGSDYLCADKKYFKR